MALELVKSLLRKGLPKCGHTILHDIHGDNFKFQVEDELDDLFLHVDL